MKAGLGYDRCGGGTVIAEDALNRIVKRHGLDKKYVLDLGDGDEPRLRPLHEEIDDLVDWQSPVRFDIFWLANAAALLRPLMRRGGHEFVHSLPAGLPEAVVQKKGKVWLARQLREPKKEAALVAGNWFSNAVVCAYLWANYDQHVPWKKMRFWLHDEAEVAIGDWWETYTEHQEDPHTAFYDDM